MSNKKMKNKKIHNDCNLIFIHLAKANMCSWEIFDLTSWPLKWTFKLYCI